MAIFRTSPAIGAISGNLGGSCFVLSASGPVIRTRNLRTRTTSNSQTTRQATWQLIRNSWRTITEDQRTAWKKAAQTFPFTNRLGVKSTLSGYQLFMKRNGFMAPLVLGFPGPFNPDPPSFATFPPWLIVDFQVDTAGTATHRVELGPPTNPYLIAYFGARTFSTSPRSSWFDFRFLVTREVRDIDRDSVIPVLNWADIIGPPGLGEQCWLHTVQLGSTQMQAHPQNISTFATA